MYPEIRSFIYSKLSRLFRVTIITQPINNKLAETATLRLFATIYDVRAKHYKHHSFTSKKNLPDCSQLATLVERLGLGFGGYFRSVPDAFFDLFKALFALSWQAVGNGKGLVGGCRSRKEVVPFVRLSPTFFERDER